MHIDRSKDAHNRGLSDITLFAEPWDHRYPADSSLMHPHTHTHPGSSAEIHVAHTLRCTGSTRVSVAPTSPPDRSDGIALGLARWHLATRCLHSFVRVHPNVSSSRALFARLPLHTFCAPMNRSPAMAYSEGGIWCSTFDEMGRHCW